MNKERSSGQSTANCSGDNNPVVTTTMSSGDGDVGKIEELPEEIRNADVQEIQMLSLIHI